MSPTPRVPLSALQHWSYCPRQCALIHVEQAFADNVFTARGRAVHRHVDEPGVELHVGQRIERAMPLWHDDLGLVGKADLVEFAADGIPCPVEYKHGRRRAVRHDELQLAGQALCLEFMTGKNVAEGVLYYFSSRRRRRVPINAALRTRTLAAIDAVRTMLQASVLPPPVNDKRCRHCSLRELCRPSWVAEQDRYRELLRQLHPGAA